MENNLSHRVCVAITLFVLLWCPFQAWAQDDVYDRFYDDDTTGTLNFFSNGDFSQVHNLWSPGDVDWAMFNADPGGSYDIRVTNQAADCNACIALYHESNLHVPVPGGYVDDWGPGGADEWIPWDAGAMSGTMFVKVTQSPFSPGLHGDLTTYTLSITGQWGPNTGLATISGTTVARVGSADGGTLQVPPTLPPPDGRPCVYTRHQAYFPPNALSQDWDFAIGNPGDIGQDPPNSWTETWLNANPGNASIVWLRRDKTSSPPQFNVNPPYVRLTVEFQPDPIQVDVDEYGTVHFTVDDLPDGVALEAMRIYRWMGGMWQLMPGHQDVDAVNHTVSVDLPDLDLWFSDRTAALESWIFAAAPGPSAVEEWQHY